MECRWCTGPSLRAHSLSAKAQVTQEPGGVQDGQGPPPPGCAPRLSGFPPAGTTSSLASTFRLGRLCSPSKRSMTSPLQNPEPAAHTTPVAPGGGVPACCPWRWSAERQRGPPCGAAHPHPLVPGNPPRSPDHCLSLGLLFRCTHSQLGSLVCRPSWGGAPIGTMPGTHFPGLCSQLT